jgi:hypothetical protein
MGPHQASFDRTKASLVAGWAVVGDLEDVAAGASAAAGRVNGPCTHRPHASASQTRSLLPHFATFRPRRRSGFVIGAEV